MLLLCGSTIGSASPVFDGWAINIDGVLFTSFISYNPATGADIASGGGLVPGAVATISTGAFDAGVIDSVGGGGQIAGGTGLGEIAISLIGSGTHTVSLWVDHHLEFGNGPVFYNEFGTVAGSLPGGFAFTIDEPGYGDPNGYTGAGHASAAANTFDNTNHLDQSGPNSPSDVSMALAITYTIPDAAYGAKWRFILGYSGLDYTSPGFSLPPGFHLEQNSVDGDGTLYFAATVEDIPEPAGWSLAAGGALMIIAIAFRRRQSVATR